MRLSLQLDGFRPPDERIYMDVVSSTPPCGLSILQPHDWLPALSFFLFLAIMSYLLTNLTGGCKCCLKVFAYM